MEWGNSLSSEDGNGVSTGCNLQCWGDLVVPSRVPFSHWKNWRLRKDLSVWCCTDLGEGQWYSGVLQPYPCVLGLSQPCLIVEELLVAFLVRESEVRNNLCCHPGGLLTSTYSTSRTVPFREGRRPLCTAVVLANPNSIRQADSLETHIRFYITVWRWIYSSCNF